MPAGEGRLLMISMIWTEEENADMKNKMNESQEEHQATYLVYSKDYGKNRLAIA